MMTDPVLNELRGMMFLARVTESGSFSAAARRLGVSRAVVSYQIKKLEDRVGVRLLNRSTRHLSLTAAGLQYDNHCKRMVSEAESAHTLLQNLREEAVGRIVMACPANLGLQWVVPVVNQFRIQYPSIELDIKFSDSISNLVEDGIDLAIRSGPLPDSELKAVKLASVTRHLCASPGYLQLNGWPKSPEELNSHRWIIYDRSSTKIGLRKGDIQHAVKMQGTLIVNSAAARLQFALADHGIALLPFYDVRDFFKSGRLLELLPEYELPQLELFAVFPTGSTTARASQLMLDMLRSHAQINATLRE